MHNVKGGNMVDLIKLEDGKYEIVCRIHSFSKISGRRDLARNSFCNLCRREIVAKELGDKFKMKASEIHDGKYSYDNSVYVKNSTPLTIKCILHNIDFNQSPSDHLAGKTGCSLCKDIINANLPQRQPKSVQLFIEQANVIHKGFFDYSEVDYKSTHVGVKIICKKHNSAFVQTPAHHLSGKNGCVTCKNKGYMWGRDDFITAYGHKDCIFYVLECFNDNELFYKIGITSKSVRQRYHRHNMPYEYRIILEYKDTAESIWDLECHFKELFKSNYYKPNMKFAGSSTETFLLGREQLKSVLFKLTISQSNDS